MSQLRFFLPGSIPSLVFADEFLLSRGSVFGCLVKNTVSFKIFFLSISSAVSDFVGLSVDAGLLLGFSRVASEFWTLFCCPVVTTGALVILSGKFEVTLVDGILSVSSGEVDVVVVVCIWTVARWSVNVSLTAFVESPVLVPYVGKFVVCVVEIVVVP